ncbi:hypothetical protein GAPWKB11_0131 [Gilliamella apicola]|nr:autotransporter outer membrane beta-barrel domain-containing protein [Gilliamella apicola]KFA59388.1 hypothetical protein GAPWKB11_0131 [Gilliamella apicola]
MEKKYKVISSLTSQRCSITSEISHHKKLKVKKILAIAALMGTSCFSYADCSSDNNIRGVFANNGSNCTFSNDVYKGSNIARIEGEGTVATFKANKVEMYNTAVNGTHSLAIGGGNGGNNIPGGSAIFEGSLQIEAGVKTSRGIYMGDGGNLLIKGDLSISKNSANGATIDIVENTNNAIINGTTKLTTKGADAIRNGGNLTFNGDLIIENDQTSGIGIHNGRSSDGILTLNKNTQIITKGMAIKLDRGTLTNNGVLTIDSLTNDSMIVSAVSQGDSTIFNNNGTIKSDSANVESMFSHQSAGTLIVNNGKSGDLSFEKGLLFSNTSNGTIQVNNKGKLLGKMDANSGIIDLDNTGVWHSNGQSNLNNVINAGTIEFLHNSPNEFYTINVKGDYVGKSGVVKMHTVWNAPGNENGDNSLSDTLKIAGSATGNTKIIPVSENGKENIIDGDVKYIGKVINTIPVVYVANSSNDTAFEGTAKTTGAIEVQLAKRITTTGDEYFWVMAVEDPSANGGISSGMTPQFDYNWLHIGSNPYLNSKSGTLIYAEPVSGYTLMPRINLEQGYSSIATLRERRGSFSCYDCSSDDDSHTWGRFFGKHHKQDGKERLNLDTNIYGLQIGHDFLANKTSNNDLFLLGAYLSYSKANTDFSDKYHAKNGIIIRDKKTGDGKSESFGLGITGTFYTNSGSYIDLVGQLSYLNNKYHARNGNNSDSQRGWGTAISAEVGQSFDLYGANWSIEPQAQLIYQYLKLNRVNDGVRHIDQNGQDGLRGRLGVMLSYNDTSVVAQHKSFYVIGNLWHDFMSSGETNIGHDKISEKFNKTWGEFGIGTQLSIAQNTSLYGDIRYEHSFSSAKRQSFSGNFGVMINW